MQPSRFRNWHRTSNAISQRATEWLSAGEADRRDSTWYHLINLRDEPLPVYDKQMKSSCLLASVGAFALLSSTANAFQEGDRKSTRLKSSHVAESRRPASP